MPIYLHLFLSLIVALLYRAFFPRMWKYVNIPSEDILFQASSRAGHYDYAIYE